MVERDLLRGGLVMLQVRAGVVRVEIGVRWWIYLLDHTGDLHEACRAVAREWADEFGGRRSFVHMSDAADDVPDGSDLDAAIEHLRRTLGPPGPSLEAVAAGAGEDPRYASASAWVVEPTERRASPALARIDEP